MERISYKARSSIARIDESSFVKAAAWAWYHHGSSKSSNESCLKMQEYLDVCSRKTKKAPRPSRYKLEAMKQVQEKSEVSHLSCKVHVQDYEDAPNSLLDSYEIDRISRDLDCYIEASHAKNCQNICCHYKRSSSEGSGTRSMSRVLGKTESTDVFCKNKGKSQGGNSSKSEMKIKQKDKISQKGSFGLIIRRSRVVCGARLDDVVDVRVRSGGSRWPEKHVAVVSVATCRPRRIK